MGQLPPNRIAPPFTIVGVGPFTTNRGNLRKATLLVKAYVCIYVCMATKAVHLETCSDLSMDTFLASFMRFIARHGLPTDVHSNNRSTFIGAANELADISIGCFNLVNLPRSSLTFPLHILFTGTSLLLVHLT